MSLSAAMDNPAIPAIAPSAAQRRGLWKQLEEEVSPISTRAETVDEEAAPARLLCQDAPSEPSIADSSSECNEETTEEAVESPAIELSRERALALQLELMAAYGSPAFQKHLHELGRKHQPRSNGFRQERHKLIRRAQAAVIPRYGFDSSAEGVELMMRAFAVFETDPDIQVNAEAIKDLLSVEAPAPLEEERRMVQKPLTKFVVVDLLRAQFVEFSKAPFQADVRSLKQHADITSGRVTRDRARRGGREDGKEDPDGYFHLKGRSELAFIVQQVLLPEYGFAPTKEGVLEMIRCGLRLELLLN
ncbi:unnamed protein product [Symbiodinium natans]|uniref:Protein C10 n=1 Tax=Symbiodinium natans TaxID=878477 RepID=A0A812MNI7_9DINO|nr:unnamed protein product [Symbiodinium natans]